MDRRAVHILSSLSSPEMMRVVSSSGESKLKPQAVVLYNRVMPGVDLSDQIRHGYQTARKRTKSPYKKIFFYLLDTALVNCFRMIQYTAQDTEAPQVLHKFRNMKHSDFRLDLVRQILDAYPREMIPVSSALTSTTGCTQSRLHERHVNIGSRSRLMQYHYRN